jgi:FixJ family two-component response regulator
MPGSPRGKVIIVEDDPSMCQALHRILRLGEFVPVLYDSAEAYLGNERKDDAICMILDVQLPGIDGFALLERLTAVGNVPPVIFITAFDEPEARARAVKAGAAFLAKPFSGRLLLETIQRIHRRGDQDAELPAVRDPPG